MAGSRVEPLGPEALEEILSLGPPGILIGGQALATWADHYRVPLPPALEAGVTGDLDFLGTVQQAQEFGALLRARFGEQVKLTPATAGDVTPNSAVIVIEGLPGRRLPLVIDYLHDVFGYFEDNDRRDLEARAVPVEFEKQPTIFVMHPFDCLKSRIHNLIGLPGKRNNASCAQGRLAIAVLRAHLIGECEDGQERKRVLPLVERIISLALHDHGVAAYHEWGVDVLEAVPLDNISSQGFHAHRWHQARNHITERRERVIRALATRNRAPNRHKETPSE